MMKKLFKVFMSVFLVFVLTGCMKINVNLEVNSDLTMNMSMEMIAQESLFSGQDQTADEWVNEQKEEILKEDGMEDATVTPIEKTIDNNKWVGILVEKDNYKNEDNSFSLKKVENDGKEQIVLTLPKDSLSDNSDVEDLQSSGYSMQQLKAVGMEMNLTIKMPSDVTSNVGTVDGDTVTIDLLSLMDEGQKEDIVITADLPSSGISTGAIIGIVAVIVVVGAIVVMKKNKNKSKNEDVVEIEHDTNLDASQDDIE